MGPPPWGSMWERRIEAVVEAVEKLASEGIPPTARSICHALLERPGVFRAPFWGVQTVYATLNRAVAAGRLEKLGEIGSTWHVIWVKPAT